ncbi:GGDEF domain-containing protein [Psychrobacter aestuarii]|uniref:diguanylate cyclase n=1 Tax=Psychrobacter aestuarii TaxID=556327 RepID=A0ABP3FBA1_9GAMM|nr:GGDEF domain-containing protein [Psychrobacter aestuarii]
MAVSLRQLSFTELSRLIFKWQAPERASLLSFLVAMEIGLHWLWCAVVWWQRDSVGVFVNMPLLYMSWLVVSILGLFFLWLSRHFVTLKNDKERLDFWQIVLIVIYSTYIGIEILIIGHSSLVSGVSLVGGTMLGMMLVKRIYIWRAFLLQVLLIVIVNIVPYMGVDLPSLREIHLTNDPVFHTHSYQTYNEAVTIENAIAAAIFHTGTVPLNDGHELHRNSALFWRSTHMYLALPKAIFIIYIFRTLLLILDASKREILNYARQDELTGLDNRRHGLGQMQQTLMTLNDHQDYSVILFDLDWFKSINDNYGHEVGDKVLKEVANILAGAFTENQIISRYGGEEFLIVLPETGHYTAMTIAEQLRADIAKHAIYINPIHSFEATASFGLYTLTYSERLRIIDEYIKSMYQEQYQDDATRSGMKMYKQARETHSVMALYKALDEATQAQVGSDMCQRLISIADKALYKAKDRGRNQVVSANEMLVEGKIDAPNGYQR